MHNKIPKCVSKRSNWLIIDNNDELIIDNNDELYFINSVLLHTYAYVCIYREGLYIKVKYYIDMI